jgi:outer membrane protein assembly factor BamB
MHRYNASSVSTTPDVSFDRKGIPMSYAVSRPAYSLSATSPEPQLRLWPGLLAVSCQWLVIGIPIIWDLDAMLQFMGRYFGPMIGALGVLSWWLFASRARWSDRLLLPLLCAAIGIAMIFLVDPSFRQKGLVIYGLPAVTTAWVVWLAVGSALSWPVRRVGLVLLFLLCWGACTTGRLDEFDSAINPAPSFRWTPTAEQQFLAERAAQQPNTPQETPTEKMPQVAEWPGFRGADRQARLTGFRIDTDWSTPPRELWRHRVGPGWSSFAVAGDRLYTQEQRGDDETVVCYDTKTGKERWVRANAGTRFTEIFAGAGPHSTPTFHEGKVYALGAKGKLECLDAATGKRIWSLDIAKEANGKIPQWGFSASPLVAKGLVSVFAGGTGGKSVLAYDSETGKPAWAAGDGLNSYASTQIVRLGGMEQIVVSSGEELTAFDPTTGKVLWKHEWPMSMNLARCLQTPVINDSDILFSTGFSKGTRRLHVAKKGDAWAAEEVWTTPKISPYFNDLVVHDGYIYGFDGNFFTCVSLEDGESKWRARGYGSGQVLLLADQGLLLVLSEKGQVALLKATPDKHTVLGKFTALKLEGKTWNHPVIAGGKLFVRNGEEMACFEMRPAK